ncbi:MAG: methyl-accepting chemotaxis protein [Proteobacteria bacterium]|nr:methyl-accepting chemotaxis protein [Burkholderiales bacterium]
MLKSAAMRFQGTERRWLPWLGATGKIAMRWACLLNRGRCAVLEHTFEGVARTRQRLLTDWANGHWEFLGAIALDFAARADPIDGAALREALAAAPEFSELFLVSPEGRVTASTFERHAGKADLSAGALKAGLEAPFLHGPYIDALTAAIGASVSPFHDPVTLMFWQPLVHAGKTLGCLCARMPNDVMSDVIQREAGHIFRESGDNYLFMVESRFDPAIKPGTALSRSRFEDGAFTLGDNLKQGVRTRYGIVRVNAHTELELMFNDPATGQLHPGVRETIHAGENLFVTYPGYPDYRHIPVVGKGITFTLPGSADRWGMMCEADLEEVTRRRSIGYRSCRLVAGMTLGTIAVDAALTFGFGLRSTFYWSAMAVWATAMLALLYAFALAPAARALDAMSGFFLRIAECGGSLADRLDDSRFRDDGTDELARWINSFVDKTDDTVRHVTGTALRVSTASDELVRASHSVAVASLRQSENAAIAAAAVEQVKVSIGQVADNATAAARLSDAATCAASDGREIVELAATEVRAIATSIEGSSGAIHRLDERSQTIGGIVRTIREIAEQTNLLALNAAIEAARAGDHGRGFAVVADEVRKLAERTARSTHDISKVIDSIQHDTHEAERTMTTCTDQAREGVEQAARAAEALGRISEGTSATAATIREIAQSTSEQRNASQEIACTIDEIAQMSETNALAVGRTEGSARNLQYLARDLRKAVRRFSAAA